MKHFYFHNKWIFKDFNKNRSSENIIFGLGIDFTRTFFKTNKLKPESSTQIPKNNKNLEIIKKQDNQEKKQGWWTQ